MLCEHIAGMIVVAKIVIRTYSKIKRFQTFGARYDYLRLGGLVGDPTFGYDRWINQMLYTSTRWRAVRDKIIIRDDGCDLGIEGREIHDKIIVHHMNPITMEDIENDNPIIYDPEFLICTSVNTHNAIHFGDESLLLRLPAERRPGDTCPWL